MSARYGMLNAWTIAALVVWAVASVINYYLSPRRSVR